MIVRINQFDAADAEQSSGWEADDVRGPIASAWPARSSALEVIILESDEKQQKLAASFRQAQLRQLLPDVLSALRESAEEIVLRFDGPLMHGELLAVFKHLADQHSKQRFAISPVQSFEPGVKPPIGSVRIHMPAPQLRAIVQDMEIGLNNNVRLRAFSVAEPVVTQLLDIDNLDDPRWPDVLSEAGFILSTSRSLQSLQIFTHKISPE